MNVQSYRKKPVVIDAIQWTGDNCKEVAAFMNAELSIIVSTQQIEIATLEGMMYANVGDHVIKGVKGEFYPCKPDIFEVTYERVEAAETTADIPATEVAPNVISVPFVITDKMITNTLDAAFEGGISYWASIEGHSDIDGINYISEVLAHGGYVDIRDDEPHDEDKEVYRLDKEAFYKGVQLYLQNGGDRDFENHDADDADQIVQYALFGEVIYG